MWGSQGGVEASSLLGTPKFPKRTGEKGRRICQGKKNPPFSYLPTPKSFQQQPPARSRSCAWRAPSPPAPHSRGLWITSFCQFFAPYLTADGRIKQSSSHISYQVLSCTVNLTALTLCNSTVPKRALSNTEGSSSRASRRKHTHTHTRGSASSCWEVPWEKRGAEGHPTAKCSAGKVPLETLHLWLCKRKAGVT